MGSNSLVPHLRELRPGMSVLDINAHPIGWITQVHRNGFQLRMPDGSTITLRREALFSVVGERASVICSQEGLSRWLLDSSDPT